MPTPAWVLDAEFEAFLAVWQYRTDLLRQPSQRVRGLMRNL